MCELAYKKTWAHMNWCFPVMVLEMTLEGPLDSKEIKPVNPKGNQPWKRPWCWERLKAGGEGGNGGWDGWMASPTQWTWILADSRRWLRTGKPGVLQSQSDITEQPNWTTMLHLGGGLSSSEELKNIIMYIHCEESEPCPKATLLILDCSTFLSALPPLPD